MARVDSNTLTGSDASTVRRALAILDRKLRQKGGSLSSPSMVRKFLSVRYALAPREVFSVIFLDAQNRLIAFEELFHGTLTQTSVFPREVVKAALQHNAAGVMFAHNHPSGVAEPSNADESLTRTLSVALGLVDVRVLDHFIVGGTSTLSFAERGILNGPAPAGLIPPKKKKLTKKRAALEIDGT